MGHDLDDEELEATRKKIYKDIDKQKIKKVVKKIIKFEEEKGDKK